MLHAIAVGGDGAGGVAAASVPMLTLPTSSYANIGRGFSGANNFFFSFSGGNGQSRPAAMNPTLTAGKYYVEFSLIGYAGGNSVGFTTQAIDFWVAVDNGITHGITDATLSASNGDRICMAIDIGAKRAWFRRNAEAWINSGDPVAGTNPHFSGWAGSSLRIAAAGRATTGSNFECHFLQGAQQVGTPPTGFSRFSGFEGAV